MKAVKFTVAILCVTGIAVVITLRISHNDPREKRDSRENIVFEEDKGEFYKGEFYNRSCALVIGATNYDDGEWSKLPGVEEDIQAVYHVLDKHGFEVTVIRDPKRADIEGIYEDFLKECDDDLQNRLLFYFAGHGYNLPSLSGEVRNYIVPVDAPHPEDNENSKQEFRRYALHAGWYRAFAEKIESKHALFVFDSCFSGKLLDRYRSIPFLHINAKVSNPVTQIIASADDEELVNDRKSIFRKFFVAALEGEADRNGDMYITGSELQAFLTEKVINNSNQSQHPQFGYFAERNKGDFVFTLRGKLPSLVASPRTLNAWDSEGQGNTGLSSNEKKGTHSLSIEETQTPESDEEPIDPEIRRLKRTLSSLENKQEDVSHAPSNKSMRPSSHTGEPSTSKEEIIDPERVRLRRTLQDLEKASEVD